MKSQTKKYRRLPQSKLRLRVLLNLAIGWLAWLTPLKLSAVSTYSATNAIVGEAAGCPFEVKLAIASAIRNRGTLRGVYGTRAAHNRYEPRWVWADARKAWLESAQRDYAKGARFFGNAADVAKGTFFGLTLVQKIGTGRDTIYFFK